jgi:hypothetical protein
MYRFFALSKSFATLLSIIAASAQLAAAETEPFARLVLPALRQSCLKCHGAKGNPKGEVNLFSLKTAADLTGNLELLESMIEALDSGEMPPEKEPPLDPMQRTQLVKELRAMLHAAVSARRTFPRTPIRRMNRFQYANAVQDLFELKVEVFALPERMLRAHGYFRPETGKMPNNVRAGSRPLGKSQLIDRRLAGVAAFPQDLRAEHGFDNRADHLSLSPLLMESFLKLSRSVVESRDFGPKTVGIWQSFFAPPSDTSNQHTADAARLRLRGFLTRAFRRPVDESTLDRYTRHVMKSVASGQSFTDSMKEVASAALASPRFLYLYDRAEKTNEAPAGEAQPLDDFELASRLSFFLWGSIPDRALLDLAAKGTLRDPAVLSEQVDRMLNDRKIKRFCDSFPAQWLQLDRIISSQPDKAKNPQFYFGKYRVSMHMMLEPLLLFETVLIEDRAILELIDPKFSYRSDLLVSWYRNGTRGRSAPPAAIPFRRVAITDRRQGGVITNAAVMTMTSSALRTKPITRGAWIATVIFNDPPKPPPADVPPLPEDNTAETKNMTLRERLDAHRKRADCRGCHAKIDPLGFALENYGPTGVWREHYENGREVDSSGVLHGKHKFANIVQFKDAILAEKSRFARAFSAHLLSFALSRQLSVTDSPALEHIVTEAAAADYRIRPLIKQVVLSKPFLHKFNPIGSGDRQPKQPPGNKESN